MLRRTLPLLLLALALPLGSCALPDGAGTSAATAYSPPPQPAARVGLAPQYRVFHDELADEGDWVLIEPYGWCFRPRVNFVAWRPYQDGYWELSDYYGWVWNSQEPFGWITYHYGDWFYDDYQGWVWRPGPAWGPAWVAWVSVGDYVGWAPLPPSRYEAYDRVPGGMFTYVGASQLTSRDVSQQAMFVTRLPEQRSSVQEIVNVGRANGIVFNKGPDANLLARLGTPIPDRVDADKLPRVRMTVRATQPEELDLPVRSQRLASEAARELRASTTPGGIAPPPTALPPALKPPAPTPRPKPAPAPPARKPDVKPIPVDSTGVHEGGPADSSAARPRRTPHPRPKPSAAPDSTRER
jgi:hypothetical protein